MLNRVVSHVRTGLQTHFFEDPVSVITRTHFINGAVLLEIAMLIFPHDKTRRADRRTMGNSGAFDPESIAACRWSRQAHYPPSPMNG